MAIGATLALPVLPTQWTQPVIDCVVLPAHAQTSDVNTDVVFSVVPENIVCAVGDPHTVTWDYVNNEDVDVNITAMPSDAELYAQHVNPPLPITLSSGESVSFSVQGVSSDIFDCSGEYGVLYDANDGRLRSGWTRSFQFE